VPRGGHPGVDDRLRGGEPEGAPGDVLADQVPILGAGDVAAGADPIERSFAIRADVGEVVRVGHVHAVALRGAGELGVRDEGALAVAFAFLVDQAQHGGAHELDVARLRREVRVGTQAGVGCRGAWEPARSDRRGHTQRGCEREQRCESGVCHSGCIDSRSPEPESGEQVWTPLGRQASGRIGLAHGAVANHPSAAARADRRRASRAAPGVPSSEPRYTRRLPTARARARGSRA
jgi:hypothetical protein